MPTRRSPLRLAALLTACSLMIPAAVSAKGRYGAERRSAPRGSMVLIENPNRASLEVMVDGELVGTVHADSSARFGPFSEGEHKVVTRYRSTRRHLTFRTSRDRVDLRRGRPVRIQVPYATKGIAEIINDWIQPMKVLIDGRSVGVVRAGSTLGAFVGNRSSIELIDPNGHVGMRTRMSLSGLSTRSLELDPAPYGRVTVHNPARRGMRIVTPAGDSVRIRPGETTSLRMPTGWTRLIARHRGRTVDTMEALVSPFTTLHYDLKVPRTGDLRFTNYDRFGVRVYSPEGHLLARVDAGETTTLRNLPVGDFALEVVADLRRRTIRDTVYVNIDAFAVDQVTSQLRVRDGRGLRYTSGSYSWNHDRRYGGRRTSRRGARSYATR